MGLFSVRFPWRFVGRFQPLGFDRFLHLGLPSPQQLELSLEHIDSFPPPLGGLCATNRTPFSNDCIVEFNISIILAEA
jgi:hypothetical protein